MDWLRAFIDKYRNMRPMTAYEDRHGVFLFGLPGDSEKAALRRIVADEHLAREKRRNK